MKGKMTEVMSSKSNRMKKGYHHKERRKMKNSDEVMESGGNEVL
jgi:hypothetical protein